MDIYTLELRWNWPQTWQRDGDLRLRIDSNFRMVIVIYAVYVSTVQVGFGTSQHVGQL